MPSPKPPCESDISAEKPTPPASETENPARLNWVSILCSGLCVVGVAWAAAYTSTHVADKEVGITAWIAVAIIGASTMIATARNSQGKG